MNVSLYVNQPTRFHGLDSRTKVFLSLGVCVLALCFSHPLFLVAILGVVIVLLLGSRAYANIKKMWVLTALLFGYSVILWPFFIHGTTPVPWLNVVGVTEEGLMVGAGMGLRLLAMVWAGIWLLSVTPIEELAIALQQLGLPGRVSFAFSLAFRWVTILLGAGVSVVQAQRSRGLDAGTGGIGDRIRKYVPLVVPLIGQALRQTHILTMALESKGFHPLATRRNSTSSRLVWWDYFTLTAVGCVVVIALWMRIQGIGVLSQPF